MSCAVKGNPKPRITWHRNHISLNTSTNYYISNTCGVCSMLILHVGPKDTGQYTITAENVLGQAECSTVLSITGSITPALHFKSIREKKLFKIFYSLFHTEFKRDSTVQTTSNLKAQTPSHTEKKGKEKNLL
uniref:Ig-like domain-containing protein n=1 Tax=Monopterus albus TaxID=43700 RepID=A0A3Q3RDU6_MONAL